MPFSNYLTRAFLLVKIGVTRTAKTLITGILLTGLVLWPYIYGHFLGYFYYGGISPSKIGLIAPYLERMQLRSTARVFLYT
jgi:hypothetical protein